MTQQIPAEIRNAAADTNAYTRTKRQAKLFQH
jgi:hypothetical protein